MPRCSVLIPAYNVERYVAKAVRSALEQTHPDVEVIVVNDGSTDGTAGALEEFERSIVYVEQENRGLSAARNKALDHATGEFVALLDADDSWMPQRLEKMLTFMEQTGSRFATSDSYLLLEERLSGNSFYDQWSRRRRFRTFNQAYWITQYNFVHIMVVVGRDLLERHGNFDERLRACEDWELWMRMLVGGENVTYLDQPLGYYRIRAGSLSFDPRRAFRDQLFMFELAESKFADDAPPGLGGRKALAAAKVALMEGDPDLARRWLAEVSVSPDVPVGWRTAGWAGRVMPKLATRAFSNRYSEES